MSSSSNTWLSYHHVAKTKTPQPGRLWHVPPGWVPSSLSPHYSIFQPTCHSQCLSNLLIICSPQPLRPSAAGHVTRSGIDILKLMSSLSMGSRASVVSMKDRPTPSLPPGWTNAPQIWVPASVPRSLGNELPYTLICCRKYITERDPTISQSSMVLKGVFLTDPSILRHTMHWILSSWLMRI